MAMCQLRCFVCCSGLPWHVVVFEKIVPRGEDLPPKVELTAHVQVLDNDETGDAHVNTALILSSIRVYSTANPEVTEVELRSDNGS